jgi:two-component system chemotaxis family response regulator WspR
LQKSERMVPQLITRPSTTSQVVVLLVDDQMFVAQAVQRLFAQDRDIAFHYCASPHEALERAEALKPTVILQDLVMPDVDGLELVRQYRARPATAEVPIIVLSSKEDPLVKSHAFAAGANDYLVKLPDRIELVARVRYHSRAYCALAELRDQATRDGLTGLWNRKMIFDTLEQELARAARNGIPLAIVMADVDKFKSINDSFGHPAGDAVLKQVGSCLSASVRTYDQIGRYGGEEFLIVLPKCNGEEAKALGERLRQAVADSPVTAEGKELHITCSFGVAFTDMPGQSDVNALVRSADEALYQAKQNGRNRVQLAPLSTIAELCTG